jgi:1-acyl-sn-glycerol-3-phosphate acyltransferase
MRRVHCDQGISSPANAVRRLPRNLYLLPGGIAEVFTSTPKKHIIVFKHRTGLCKLSLDTGVHLVPCYVFGGTDFFHNLATGDGLLSRFSRSIRAGITIFWGRFGLPIPFAPKVTLCIADPIPVEKWTKNEPIPQELIQALHEKYLASIQELFDRYKEAAGYKDAVLEIR